MCDTHIQGVACSTNPSDTPLLQSVGDFLHPLTVTIEKKHGCAGLWVPSHVIHSQSTVNELTTSTLCSVEPSRIPMTLPAVQYLPAHISGMGRQCTESLQDQCIIPAICCVQRSVGCK